MRKILIAVPCMDSVPAQFAHSLATLTSYGVKDCAVSVWFNLGSLIYTSRNEIAKRAISDACDLVMWFDSDMVFNPDTLIRMLKLIDDGNDMVTGVYYRRTHPFSPVVFETMDIDEADKKASFTEFEEIPDDLFEVAACGFGCVLMKTEMFISVYSNFHSLFDPIGGVGEDIAFCWRARQCGYKIIADPSIVLGHVGHTVISKEFYKTYQLTRKNKEIERSE